MIMKLNLIFLLFISQLYFSEQKSYDVCPDEERAHFVLGTVRVVVDAQEHTSLIRRIRLPTEGLYDEKISCFMAGDISSDDSGGDAEITDGGVGHRFVEVRLNSKIGQPLLFLVVVYTNDAHIANANRTVSPTVMNY